MKRNHERLLQLDLDPSGPSLQIIYGTFPLNRAAFVVRNLAIMDLQQTAWPPWVGRQSWNPMPFIPGRPAPLRGPEQDDKFHIFAARDQGEVDYRH